MSAKQKDQKVTTEITKYATQLTLKTNKKNPCKSNIDANDVAKKMLHKR